MADVIFRIVPDPEFDWPVRITGPGEASAILTVRYRHKPWKDAIAWLQAKAGNDQDDPDALLEIIAGWADADQPFSREAVGSLIANRPGAVKELLDGWLLGLRGAREKN